LGAADQGPPARELLRQHPARCDVVRHARPVRHLLRHDPRPGLLLWGFRRQLERNRPRPAGGIIRRGTDASMIRVIIPYHLKTLSGVTGEVQLDLATPVT